MTTIEIGTRLFILALVVAGMGFLIAISVVGGRSKK